MFTSTTLQFRSMEASNGIKQINIYGLRISPLKKNLVYCLKLDVQQCLFPSNIAEGAARNSSKEFAYFINVSRGSLSEVENSVPFSHRFRYS